MKSPMEEHKKEAQNNQKENNKEDKPVTLKGSEYQALKEEAGRAAELKESLLRLQADFENSRKRLDREKQDFIKFANEGLILDLLNVLDDLERSVELSEKNHQDLQAFLKGVEMILAHLYQMLKGHGVKPIEALGKGFDPNFHEALMQVEDNNLPEHTVVEEMQKGYMLNDRVIRTSKVKVSKKPEVQNG